MILNGVAESKKEHGKELIEKLAVGMQEFQQIVEQRERDAVAPKQKELLQYVGGWELYSTFYNCEQFFFFLLHSNINDQHLVISFH